MGRYDGGGYSTRYGSYGGGGSQHYDPPCRVGKRTLTDGLVQRVQAKKKDEDQSHDPQEVQADKIASGSAHMLPSASREEHFMKCGEPQTTPEEAMKWPTGKQPVTMLELLFKKIKIIDEKRSHRKSCHDADFATLDAESVHRKTEFIELVKLSLNDLMDMKHIIKEADEPHIKDDLIICYVDAPFTTTATDEISIIRVGNGAFEESLKFLVLAIERELYRLTKQHAQDRVCESGHSAGYGDYEITMQEKEMIDLEINALQHSQWQSKNIDDPTTFARCDAKIISWKKLKTVLTLSSRQIMQLRDLPDEVFIQEAEKIASKGSATDWKGVK